ncbi:glycosyltransferase [Rhizobium sp. Leaf371]|uniref:glycosyltransferase n=1 Tax=Rhizobium sp. Leaf371 TaxID=1736355 RepID=UPI0009E76F75|nr:glycosyltransferase [Rhizobium sp. Leaf371]
MTTAGFVADWDKEQTGLQDGPGPDAATVPTDVAVVVIGRNEGARLIACLRSLGACITRTVYVDSGSSDGSVAAARDLGATVVQLDITTPFTAARARNAGFQAAMARWPDTAVVQFIDGDCTLDAGWIGTARDFLRDRPSVALVFGRRRERFPETSVFNALCDREWSGPPGKALECGGDILIRADLFRQMGGYRSDLIAGEEPELCVRLRAAGWSIWRLDCEMTQHDADIHRFGQWWRRAVRSGHAFAEVAGLHRHAESRIWGRSLGRAILWGGVLPGSALIGAFAFPPAILLLALYPAQIARMALRQEAVRRSSGGTPRGPWARVPWRNALFDMLGKFPEFQGAMTFYINTARRRRQAIIEYK